MKTKKIAKPVLDFLEDRSRDNEEITCLVESAYDTTILNEKINVELLQKLLTNRNKSFNYIESARVFVVDLCKTEIAMLTMFDFVGYISLNRVHKI